MASGASQYGSELGKKTPDEAPWVAGTYNSLVEAPSCWGHGYSTQERVGLELQVYALVQASVGDRLPYGTRYFHDLIESKDEDRNTTGRNRTYRGHRGEGRGQKRGMRVVCPAER